MWTINVISMVNTMAKYMIKLVGIALKIHIVNQICIIVVVKYYILYMYVYLKNLPSLIIFCPLYTRLSGFDVCHESEQWKKNITHNHYFVYLCITVVHKMVYVDFRVIKRRYGIYWCKIVYGLNVQY